MILFAAAYFLIVSPWLIRNHIQYDHPGLTSQGRAHIISYVMPYVMQYEKGINITAAKENCRNLWREKEESLPNDVTDNPFLVDREGKRFGLSYLMNASPVSLAKAWFWGGMKNIFSPVTVELAFLLRMDRTLFHESDGNSVPVQLFNFIFKNSNVAYGFLMVAGLLGILLFRLIQLHGMSFMVMSQRESLLICLLIIFYFLIISGPVGYAKYRIPMEPVLALFSAFSFDNLRLGFKGILFRNKSLTP